MSHELTVANGVAEMAFVGETPWHGLGQSLAKGASIEQWTKAAGMAWSVKRSKVRYFADRDGMKQLEWPDQHVLFSSDNSKPLGLVSPKFKVVQPAHVLGFFKDLVEGNGFEMETAGTLFGGRRFWALASIGESAAVLNPQDVVGGYLLLCTGVDGTLATTARFTTVRVVCNNTLSMATAGAADVSVTHRSKFDAAAVKDSLGIARGQFAGFISGMRDLAAKRIAYEDASILTSQLLRPLISASATPKELAEVDARVASSQGYQNILSLFNGKGRGATMEGVHGTAWGWVNAVTQHVDYSTKCATADNRLDSAWFGRGDALKAKAVQLAVAA